MNRPRQQKALERLKQVRSNGRPRTCAQAYAQMDRLLSAQRKSGASSATGRPVKG